MKYQKSTVTTGNWAKASQLKDGTKAKIVSETRPVPSQFQDKQGNPKNQDVCKVRFEGMTETLNVSLNRATINGLIEAFGDDSVAWQGHELTVLTEKVRVAGKLVTTLYLVPQGFEKVDDDNGYAVIVKRGSKPADNVDIPVVNEESDIDRVNAETAGMEKDEVEVPF